MPATDKNSGKQAQGETGDGGLKDNRKQLYNIGIDNNLKFPKRQFLQMSENLSQHSISTIQK